MSQYAQDVAQGERFEFGKNWDRFLSLLNNRQIEEAEKSLKEGLEVEDLEGKSFCDIGCGSGLFSLAARRLGAMVHSFDYDPQSVACTERLKRRYLPDDTNWTIEEGSVLDTEYLKSLGEFDIIYAWGVLHHTGAMWQALKNVQLPVSPGGRLFISVYNDQGWISTYWNRVKKTYNKGLVFRSAIILIHMPYLFGMRFLIRALTGRLNLDRGMSLWCDMLDWLGGYPFEVAEPERICDFYRQQAFILLRLKTCGTRHGCNEFVFERTRTARE